MFSIMSGINNANAGIPIVNWAYRYGYESVTIF